MRVHVRGQMGVQLMQAFVGISRLLEDETPIIVVNSGGDVPGAKTSQLHWVTDPQCEIKEDHDGIRKTPYWQSGAASVAFSHRERVMRWLPLQDRPIVNTGIVLHARGGDKLMASVDTYRSLLDLIKQNHPGQKITILSDDADMLDALRPPSEDADVAPPEEDWFRIFNAEHVYCAPSAFVMSTLLYNPNKHVTYIGQEYCDGTYRAIADDYVFIDESHKFCPNLKVLRKG